MSYIATAVFIVLVSICIAAVVFPERKRDRRPRPWHDRLNPDRKYLRREHRRKYFDVR
jgi:hypothetical protein